MKIIVLKKIVRYKILSKVDNVYSLWIKSVKDGIFVRSINIASSCRNWRTIDDVGRTWIRLFILREHCDHHRQLPPPRLGETRSHLTTENDLRATFENFAEANPGIGGEIPRNCAISRTAEKGKRNEAIPSVTTLDTRWITNLGHCVGTYSVLFK